MGTNFYLKQKLSKQQTKEVKKLIDDFEYEKAEEIISSVLPIHIGKRSYGWKFFWDSNKFKYYEPNKESLIKFLKSGTIIDEYNKEFSFDEFWNNELDGCLDKGYDLEAYYTENPNNYVRIYRPFDYEIVETAKRANISRHDINKYGEYYIDGLLFTIHEDFS